MVVRARIRSMYQVFPFAPLPSRYPCIAVSLSISYSVQAPVLFMPIYIHSCVAFIYALHLFLRYIHSCACILSLFSCISHKAQSPPGLFFSLTCMVSDRLVSPTSDQKTHNVHSPTHQPPTIDDNNVSLLDDRESSSLKLNRLICLIIRRGG